MFGSGGMTMYDTLIMLKPGASFAVDELHALVVEVVDGGEAAVEREGGVIRIAAGDGVLTIEWDNAAHVVDESNEIAEQYGVPSRGCAARLVMSGDDPDMDLLNDYALINERLHATGKFVIFDTEECKLLFE